MINVREEFNLGKGRVVLVCDMFDDRTVSSVLKVDGEEIDADKLQVERQKGCFSLPETRNIVVQIKKTHGKVNTVEFA